MDYQEQEPEVERGKVEVKCSEIAEDTEATKSPSFQSGYIKEAKFSLNIFLPIYSHLALLTFFP